MNIGIQLTEKQITSLKNKANIEVDREIYSIRFDSEEITINGSWSIQRENKPINQEIVSAIETYCTRNNKRYKFKMAKISGCYCYSIKKYLSMTRKFIINDYELTRI